MDFIEDETEIYYQAIGLNKYGEIIPNGYFRLFATESEVFQEDIRLFLIENLENLTSHAKVLSEFKKKILQYPIQNEIILKEYRTYIDDLFSRKCRIEAMKRAELFGLKYFVYDGTLIRDSRKFCIERNSKVFTIEQANKWKSMTWEGKCDPYDPIIDMGGYGCRHMARFITDDYAFERMEQEEENDKQ